jgi:hypothetical protein
MEDCCESFADYIRTITVLYRIVKNNDQNRCLGLSFQVREHAQALVPQGVVDEGKKLPLPDSGLEGALFAMLDFETNMQLRERVQVSTTLHGSS